MYRALRTFALLDHIFLQIRASGRLARLTCHTLAVGCISPPSARGKISLLEAVGERRLFSGGGENMLLACTAGDVRCMLMWRSKFACHAQTKNPSRPHRRSYEKAQCYARVTSALR